MNIKRLDAKVKRVQQELDAWVHRAKVLGQNEHVIVSVRIEGVGKHTSESVLNMRVDAFLTRQLFEDAGFPRLIAGRAASFARAMRYSFQFRQGDAPVAPDLRMSDFLRVYPSRRELMRAKNVGAKVASAIACVLKQAYLPFEG